MWYSVADLTFFILGLKGVEGKLLFTVVFFIYCCLFINFKVFMQWILTWNLMQCRRFRSSPPKVFCKIGVFKIFAKFTGKHFFQSLILNKATGCILKETQTLKFSCELCEIFKNTFFTEHFQRLLLKVLGFITKV